MLSIRRQLIHLWTAFQCISMTYAIMLPWDASHSRESPKLPRVAHLECVTYPKRVPLKFWLHIRNLPRFSSCRATTTFLQYRPSFLLLSVEREHPRLKVLTKTTPLSDLVTIIAVCTWPSVLLQFQLSVAERSCRVSSSTRNLHH
jgi:hypothetical protein